MCRWEADSPSAVLKSHLFVRNRKRIWLFYTQSSETSETTQLTTRRPIPVNFQTEQERFQKLRSHIFKSFFSLAHVAVLLQGLQFNGTTCLNVLRIV